MNDQAYSWETERIDNPNEFARVRARSVPELEVIPKPEPSDGPSLSAGQTAATSAISAALQRLHDPETARLLEAVPKGAWGAGKEFADDVELITVAIRNGVPDAVAELQGLSRYGYAKGDPWKLEEYCTELSKEWAKFGRLIPETPEPEVEAEAPIFGYQIKVGETTITVTGAPPAPTALPEPEVEAPTPEPEANSPRPITFASMAAAFPKLRPAVIDGLLRQGETMNVIAATKVGKSWLMYDLGLSITAGGRWLDYFQCTPGRVLLIDNELHPETLAHRIPKVAEARRIPAGWESRLDVLSLRGVGLTLDTLAPIVQKIKAGEYAAIIFDAWYRFVPAGINENDNAAIMGLYNLLDKYAASTGAAMIAVHHASKGAQGDKAVTDMGAGAGSQSRAADTHLVLRQHEEDGCIVLEAAVRSFPPVEPLGLRWDFPCWQPAYNLDTEAVQGRRPRHEVQRDEKDRAAFEAILVGLAGGPMSVRDVRRVLGGAGQERAERLLDRLEKDGAVIWESVKIHGGTAKVYSLTQPGLEPGLEPGTAA